MKKLSLLSVCCLMLIGSASAFWQNADNLERTEQLVRVNHQGSQSQVSIEETILNNTDTVQTYRYLAPVGNASGLNLYQDSAGIAHEKLTGPTLLETLWNTEERNLLQLGHYHDTGVLVSQEIILNPGESTRVRLKYNTTPETKNGTSILTIDLADRKPSQAHLVSFNLTGSNRHFLAPWQLKGDQLIEGSTTTWLYEGDDTAYTSPLTFVWSNQSKPTLTYRAPDADYHLTLEASPNPITWETVTILIDQSGSMFGDRWEQSQVLVKEFLKNLSSNTRIRVGFFDNQISWFHDVPVTNNATEQKKFFDWWAAQVPAGRTNWSLLQEVLRDLQLDQDPLSKSAGLIIGDFSQFAVNEANYFNLKSFRRSLLLDFAQNDTAATWSRVNDGQYFKLIPEDEDLIQWSSLWQKWQSLHLPQTPTLPGDHRDIVPAEINYFPPETSLLWLSRSDTASSANLFEKANFIPALWDARQMAQEKRGEALIKSPANLTDAWREIWQLEGQQVDVPFQQNGVVIEEIEPGKWASPQFDQQFPIKAGIEIAPWSVAERQLFYFFPDLLARALSLGEDVNFCSVARCVQLDRIGETTPEETHKLDWRGPLKPHWANQHVLTLARENIVPVNPFPEQNLDDPITRGDFIMWLTKWYFGTDFTERTAAIGDPRFTDIADENTEMAEAIYLLRRKGVIQGYPDGTVRPDRPLARAEAVKIILALDGYTPKETEERPFRDISGWEVPWVVQAQKAGLVQGYGDGTFKPFQPLSKGEGIKLIASFD